MTLATFLTLLGLQVMAAISPGPAVILAARTGMSHGLRSGVFLAAGIGAGAVFWAASALFGLAILFTLAPGLLMAIKLLGGAYLVWMGLQIWRHAAEPITVSARDTAPRSALSNFWRGVTTQLANPKPVVFFGAVFAGVVPPGTSLPWLLMLLCIVFASDFLWNVLIARLFSFEGARRGYLSLKTVIDRSFGGLLTLLGARIALG